VTDSFKALTRNIEKLLLVMEYLLQHDVPFVTSNYFITNGYIERRAKLLKAASDATTGIHKNWLNPAGLCLNHKAVLQAAARA